MSGFLRRAYISYSRSAQRKTKGGGSWGILQKETCVEEPARGKVRSSAREATDRHRCEVTQRGARAVGGGSAAPHARARSALTFAV